MCGICGIIGWPEERARAPLERMVQALAHRGPDAQAVSFPGSAALGHARLSIIDLAGGGQPMTSADGRCHIVFNGEIYNYAALRPALESRGARFATRSDTEVLMEHARVFGREGLSRLNGMFAFAVWNPEKRTLFAARDRMGKKPFYYAEAPGGAWLFASEIKSILASGLIEPRPDRVSADAYLALGYVPSDRTIYANIHSLPPGCGLEWEGGRVRVERYWSPVYTERDIGEDEAAEELNRLLREAVKLRMMASDVPVGAFLSGGLDSSTVVILAQRQMDRPVQTFSIRIKDHGRDETPFAREVARQEGTDHHDIELDLNVDETIGEMASLYDEPFGDPSNIPTHLVSKFARQTVKTVITGDGGDELFGGYDTTYCPLIRSEQLPSRGLGYRALAAADTVFGPFAPELRASRRLADEARQWPDLLHRHMLRNVRFLPHQRAALWAEPTPAYEPTQALEALPGRATGMNRVFQFDTAVYLPGDILVKVDRAAMAVGLETRSPILDPGVVEFSLSLPLRLKTDSRIGKKIFRRAFESLWPASLRTREKMGFGVPEDLWLRRPDVESRIRRLAREVGPAWFREDALRSAIESYYRDRKLWPIQMWTLMSFLTWAERWGKGNR